MRFQIADFTFDAPDDWEDRSIITFAAPVTDGGFAPNLVVTREKVGAGVSVEEYAGRQFDIARGETGGLRLIARQNATLGGRPCVEIVQRLTARGLNLQQLQAFILLDGEICVLTCTATVGDFNASLPRFRKIFDSLRFS